MDVNQFIEKANKISDNPLERLSKVNRQIYQTNNFVIDIHTHLFDVKTVNIKYFLIRLIKDFIGLRSDEPIIAIDDPNLKYLKSSQTDLETAPLFQQKFDNDQEWLELENELNYVESNSIIINQDIFITNENKVRGFRDIWKAKKILSLDNMEEVYDFYRDNYSLDKISSLGLNNKKLFITGLMMDLETGWGVKTRKSFEDQILEYINLGQKFPILPFFACDPRRENLYDLFLKAFPENGPSFFGVKIYPGLGYSPSDYRLWPIYEICESKNIPVLTHCGGESVTTDSSNLNIYRGTEEIELNEATRQKVASILNHPKEWEIVLKKFPNLKLNLGHFGGDTAWGEKDLTGKSEKVDKAIEIIKLNKSVYADFSYNLIDSSKDRIYFDTVSLDKDLISKLLYGTDFWVVLPSGDLMDRQEKFLKESANREIFFKIIDENPKKYLFQ
jgi:predicted TIM-barrel fold metal-dependent hydrolase